MGCVSHIQLGYRKVLTCPVSPTYVTVDIQSAVGQDRSCLWPNLTPSLPKGSPKRLERLGSKLLNLLSGHEQGFARRLEEWRGLCVKPWPMIITQDPTRLSSVRRSLFAKQLVPEVTRSLSRPFSRRRAPRRPVVHTHTKHR